MADLSTGTETWAGSLKFPLLNDTAVIRGPSYSTIEVYGGGAPIRPIDVPILHVSLNRPVGDGHKSSWGVIDYSPFNGDIMNSEARYESDEDVVHLIVGGLTERRTPESAVTFR